MVETRGTVVNYPAAEIWSTSKCQRLLRPLKSKLTALEKVLISHANANDGVKRRPATRKPKVSSDNGDYLIPSGRVRKYGSRKQEAKSSQQEYLNADDLTIDVRANVSPALGNAYMGVYYAFKAIMDKAEPSKERTFPSLATLASDSVGSCIHLTSSQYTEDPIDADDWFESTPEHFRSTVVIAYAVQLLIASYTSIKELVPAFITLLRHHSCAEGLLEAMVEHTCLTNARRVDIHMLQRLAEMTAHPSIPIQHFTKHLTLHHTRTPAFMVIVKHKEGASLHRAHMQLYLRAFEIWMEERDDTDTFRSLAEDLCPRILRTIDVSVWRHLYNLSKEHDHMLSVTFALALSILVEQSIDITTTKAVKVCETRWRSSSSKTQQDIVSFLLRSFSDDRLVEIVETLVGRVDTLAVHLAGECATHLDGDFSEWATGIERDVMEAKNGSSERYRFEPLLDSWVARTPGLVKINSARTIAAVDSDLEDEEDELASGNSSFVPATTIALTNLLTTATDSKLIDDEMQIGPEVCAVLSARRSTELQKSAKLLERFHRISNENKGQASPLVKCGPLASLLPIESPLQCKSKRKLTLCDASGSSPMRKVRRGPPVRSNLKEMLEQAQGCRTSRAPLRELNNLKSGFAARRNTQKQVITDRETDASAHPKSESDELSML